VNGEVRQRARLPGPGREAAALVAAASSVMTLLPGDVLLAGAGGGAGAGVALDCGDEVSVSIDGVGTLTNRVEKGD
jgi:2-keto-4-pentenoate hydratase/2-oxohepta-3-ene-1,7-dioic acid hydratase in catechol pathway